MKLKKYLNLTGISMRLFILLPKTIMIFNKKFCTILVFYNSNVVHFASLRNYTYCLSNKIWVFSGMNVVFPLLLFAVMGLVIPAYAQNISQDENDIKIRDLIQECHEKVMADKSTTESEKTVAKRNCETEITNKYKSVEIDYQEFDEIRMKLQKIQNCEDWHPQYRYLTEAQFRLQKNVEAVNDCILLYKDSFWNYTGENRLEKLVDRLDEIKSELPKDPETRHVTLDVNIPHLESNIINSQQDVDEVNLKEKVRLLEEELVKKDAIIKEQLKVIMELVNRLKNIMFNSLSSFLIQL